MYDNDKITKDEIFKLADHYLEIVRNNELLYFYIINNLYYYKKSQELKKKDGRSGGMVCLSCLLIYIQKS